MFNRKTSFSRHSKLPRNVSVRNNLFYREEIQLSALENFIVIDGWKMNFVLLDNRYFISSIQKVTPYTNCRPEKLATVRSAEEKEDIRWKQNRIREKNLILVDLVFSNCKKSVWNSKQRTDFYILYFFFVELTKIQRPKFTVVIKSQLEFFPRIRNLKSKKKWNKSTIHRTEKKSFISRKFWWFFSSKKVAPKEFFCCFNREQINRSPTDFVLDQYMF